MSQRKREGERYKCYVSDVHKSDYDEMRRSYERSRDSCVKCLNNNEGYNYRENCGKPLHPKAIYPLTCEQDCDCERFSPRPEQYFTRHHYLYNHARYAPFFTIPKRGNVCNFRNVCNVCNCGWTFLLLLLLLLLLLFPISCYWMKGLSGRWCRKDSNQEFAWFEKNVVEAPLRSPEGCAAESPTFFNIFTSLFPLCIIFGLKSNAVPIYAVKM